MAKELGREICNTLQQIQKEVEKSNASNKRDLLQAIQQLLQFKQCDRL